ncbi:MAG: hypothetical protein AVDCRST_MAG32-2306, partial [uncultured Nocardioides sp.]
RHLRQGLGQHLPARHDYGDLLRHGQGQQHRHQVLQDHRHRRLVERPAAGQRRRQLDLQARQHGAGQVPADRGERGDQGPVRPAVPAAGRRGGHRDGARGDLDLERHHRQPVPLRRHQRAVHLQPQHEDAERRHLPAEDRPGRRRAPHREHLPPL